jgi:DNA-binding Lrp family transcriptional regulator
LAIFVEVIEVYLHHPYDYFVKVAVESTADYERFLREKLYRIPGICYSRSSPVRWLRASPRRSNSLR